ncbi:hypothetical protein H1D32_17710 [Anaerobacillus sp. CMMVII]|uniref:hypothetical protein n=1 Tax=Anaerobacillus sp. CMMVII TaxID=2755588 RepID=UPI0021B7E006|nr:hypothetical protein [Anaerobacillus sp. CMMVII]MCT8139379.1 hypothetical protein [Anaerobacillus sp. CMMVII]
MGKSTEITISELIKKLGITSEANLRNYIQSLLEDEEILNLVKNGIRRHLSTVNLLRNNSDILSQQLNFPTKNDVANIAKLAIQIEDKIDALEERIFHLSEAQQIQDTPVQNVVRQQGSELSDAQLTEEIANIKRLLKMNLILNAGNITTENGLNNRIEDLRNRGKRRG